MPEPIPRRAARPAHHHRSRRARPRPRRHPALLAPPRHRSAQLPARPPRPLPPRGPPCLDRLEGRPAQWTLTRSRQRDGAGIPQETRAHRDGEDVPRRPRPLPPAVRCAPAWRPTNCTPGSRTPLPTRHQRGRPSWVGSSARWTRTAFWNLVSELVARSMPGRLISSGWLWPRPTPGRPAAPADQFPRQIASRTGGVASLRAVTSTAPASERNAGTSIRAVSTGWVTGDPRGRRGGRLPGRARRQRWLRTDRPSPGTATRPAA
jgi:hypothetical protein